MTKLSITILGWLIGLGQYISQVNSETQQNGIYQHHVIPHNPGLYYEKIDQIRTINKHWRLMLTIDLENLIAQPLAGTTTINIYHQECLKSNLQDCREVLGLTILDDYTQELKTIQQHLQKMLESPNPTKRISRAPLLGFVGSISRALFGTMDYNDHEHITKEIDRLYQDQKKITHLIENSTHIIQAEVNSVKKINEQNMRRIANAEERLKQFVISTNHMARQMESIEYYEHLGKIFRETEYAARKHLEAAHKVIDAIEQAKHGKLHPALINNQRLEKAIEEIEKNNPESVFPLQKEKLDIALLAQIGTIETGFLRGKFLATINIPLLTREPMDLYRIISCKTPQIVHGNQTTAIYIEPTSGYIATSRFHQRYSLPDDKFLKTCIPLENCLACPRAIPLRKQGTRVTCEQELLLNPDVEINSKVYKTCNIRVTNNLETQWNKLISSEGWIYSTIQPEKLEISCKNDQSATLILNGTGIIHLHPSCSAETPSIVLEGSGLVESQLPTIQGMPKTINISELAPILHDPIKPIKMLTKLEPYTLPKEDDNTFDESLQQTIDEAKKKPDYTIRSNIIIEYLPSPTAA